MERKKINLEGIVESFNKKYPVGTDVAVRRDNGESFTTLATQKAYVMGGHTPVIHVKGISGCYLLDRVSPIVETQHNQGG